MPEPTPATTTAGHGLPEHLDPSELGTKEHWESAYARETQNFLENPSDEGIIWFSESCAEERMIQYLSSLPLSASSASFLDVGTGNGHLLFELREADEDEEYAGLMVGIDYAPASVDLARTIARQRGLDVRFETVDVIQDELMGQHWVPPGGFDVVLDKGTFDAISLSEEMLSDGRRVVEAYPAKVAAAMRKGGWLVVTSCNWTEEELGRRIVEGAAGELQVYGRVKYPSFTFGGVAGQTVCTLCFRRRE
ncbi:S-adenosyl-L-methionine-dependent methyltransferase [Tricharina praecox]|uniref:S-adenosyl-L-methionine-dependent methyltransferase n=1 Tax=Tricharina praecox TaxID=43433 RepID=UPI002220A995|nr:S-adenosyl-L-methionine-dependent methyltransferase [Tricharina praecox]KAI5853353.1 S-adenosyl-L-methionine-dependent methyltransferase [Tricharina praecox]